MGHAIKARKMEELTDAEIDRVRCESVDRQAKEPYAESVDYDAASRVITVRLRGGSVVAAPANSVTGLDSATDAQCADVRFVVAGRFLGFFGRPTHAYGFYRRRIRHCHGTVDSESGR